MREEIILHRDASSIEATIPLLALRNYIISIMEFGDYNSVLAARGVHKVSVYYEGEAFYVMVDVHDSTPSVFATKDSVGTNTSIKSILYYVVNNVAM